MTNLPQGVQLILPIFTADRGRARAGTLLAIQGLGPEYVRQHLTVIDAALGPASPGTAALADLIVKAEEAVSTSRPTIGHQHVISKSGVLDNFTEDVPRRGMRLTRFDIDASRPELKGARKVGYVTDFVPVDSKATEELWHREVETHLTQAITAALDGTALGRPVHLSTLRNAVALHFTRNPQTLTVHNESFAYAIRDPGRYVEPDVAAQAFRRDHSGLWAAGPYTLQLGAEAVVERLVRLHEEGGLFRLSVQRLFEMVCDRFGVRGIQILIPASPSKEFLLGDTPALTVNHATGAVGAAEGVTVGQADEIFMPVAPRLLVTLGPPDGARSISDDQVDQYNSWQARSAKDYVVWRPGADFTASIAAWRSTVTSADAR